MLQARIFSSSRRHADPRRRGSALAAALFASMVAASMVMLLVQVALATNRAADVERHRASGHYRALGAIETVQKSLSDALANYGELPEAGEVVLDGHEVQYELASSGLELIREDEVGTRTMVLGFDLTATSNSDGALATVRRTVHCDVTPIFQWAVFYDSDLEFFPGPSAVLSGRIHANGNMHLGSGGTLSLNSNSVRATGGAYRRRKDQPDSSPGAVQIRRWVENTFDPREPREFVPMLGRAGMDALGITTESGFDSAFVDGHDDNADGDHEDEGDWMPWGPEALEQWSQADDYWGGEGQSVMTGDHGVVEASPPGLGAIEMFSEDEHGDHEWHAGSQTFVPTAPGDGTHSMGHFRETADLSLYTRADGSWGAYDQDGIPMEFFLDDAVTVSSLYDARQANGSGTETRVLELDVARLAELDLWPANGLIYVGHYGLAEGTRAKGVVLKHGAELAAPLTVVTESALFVEGDFNVVEKKPAAVIADAVNLLSNAWDGRKAAGDLPEAEETTFNLAFVTGNHASVEGTYNGGLENLPRFHENWSDIPCHIKGSFVNLWESRYATGRWSYGSDRYTAPDRRWSFDPDFNDFDKLPPHTPMAVEAYEVVTF